MSDRPLRPPSIPAARAALFGLLAVLVLWPAGQNANADPARAQPASIRGGCGLVDVDTIRFQRGSAGWQLYIAGLKRFANMDVSLQHRRVGAGAWAVDVIGCTAGIIGLPVRTPYWLAVPLRDLPGAKSIRIVAANGVWRPRMPY